MNQLNRTFLIGLISLATLEAHADRFPVPLHPALRIGALAQTQAVDVDQAVYEIAAVMAAWNPTLEQQIIEEMLRSRIQKFGMFEGLIRPSLAMIDTALISSRPEIASLISPSVSRLSPSIGEKLGALGLPNESSSHRNIRSRADKIIGHRDMDVMTASRAKSLRREILGMDRTGISLVMFGPGSFIYDRTNDPSSMMPSELEMVGAGDGSSRRHDRSPIFGITAQEARSCMNSCSEEIKSGSERGKKVAGDAGEKHGTWIITAGGIAAGNAATVILGLSTGDRLGKKAGEIAGTVSGAVVSGASCISSCLSETRNEAATPKASPPKDIAPTTSPSAPTPPRPSTGGGEGISGNDCVGGSCNIARPVNPNDEGDSAPPINPRGPRPEVIRSGLDAIALPVFGKFGGLR